MHCRFTNTRSLFLTTTCLATLSGAALIIVAHHPAAAQTAGDPAPASSAPATKETDDEIVVTGRNYLADSEATATKLDTRSPKRRAR